MKLKNEYSKMIERLVNNAIRTLSDLLESFMAKSFGENWDVKL